MRIYENLFIVRPDATEEETDHLIDQLKGVITAANGTVEKAEKWGTKKLAYKIGKYGEGIYILLQFNCTSEVPKEVERRQRVSDLVVKFLTVRIDEKLKKRDKRQKEREKRAKRKPVMAAPPPAAMVPGEPAAPTPGAPAPGAPVPAAPVQPAPVQAPPAAPAAPTAN